METLLSAQQMNIYTEVTIAPHHAGFGMFQSGEIQASPETSYAFEADLLEAISQNSEEVLPIEEAISSADFLALGIEDIRGKIYNQPSKVFARINHGELSYFGIEEIEVANDFFAR